MNEHGPSAHPAFARIDLDQIRENYRALRDFTPTKTVIPVVKADAYGHGAVAVSRVLEEIGVPLIAVAYVTEALELRAAGVRSGILVLTGFAPEQWRDVLRHELTPVISTAEQARIVAAHDFGEDAEAFAVHLKVDTGMSRLGFRVHELEPIVHRLEDRGGVEIRGLMTHLAAADEDELATKRQLDTFDEAIFRLQTLGVRPPLIHAANSAGLSFVRDTHTATRPGLLLYGARPRPLAPEISVGPAMEVRARVALVKTVPRGAAVSYGGRFVAQRDTRIATVNIGYADGIPRTDAMRDRGVFAWKDSLVRVAGTVCMDLTMLDVTDVPDIEAGSEVVFLGGRISVWSVADCAGTNAWQVMTGIGKRVPRRYVLNGRALTLDDQT